MLSIAFFGVTCEVQTEEEENLFSFSVDHFSMTRQEAEATGLVAPEENSTQTEGLSWSSSWSPDQESWWQKRQRRRKKRSVVSFTEFVELSDGRRVIVRSDRGFSESWKHSPGPFHGDTQESFADDIRYCFVQYEEDRPTPPEWIIERLRRLYGTEIDAVSVYDAMRAPLRVELGPRLLQLLPQQ